jgi:sugar lactone lactonase YvrE
MGVLTVWVALLACAQEEHGPAAETARERWTVEAFSEELPCGTGGIEVDAHGNVYVGDFGSKLGPADGERQGGDRVFRIDPAGAVSVFARGLRGASGNALGPGGDLFQSSIGGDTITRITPAGEASLFLTRGLRAPVGIAIDAEGMLFVANCGSNSVVEVTPFAGSGARGAADGPALEATFSFPNDIVVAPDGKSFYVNQPASTTAPHTELAPTLVRRIRLASARAR